MTQDQRDLELLTIRNIMKTENGRAFMFRCLENCGTFNGTFDNDTHKHAFNAGLRQHGLWLDSELRDADDDSGTDYYYQMLKENR